LIRILLLLIALAAPAAAEEVVADLSQNRVSITTNFDGSEILVFGAIKREATIDDEPMQVIVAVAGPDERIVVRKKDRRLGIWVNTDAVEVDAAPSFYAVATTAPWEVSISDLEDLRHHVSIDRAIRLVGAPMDVENAADFGQAIVRIREQDGLYQTNIGAVELTEQTLFRTSVALPANLHEGDYRTRIFLTRNGAVIDAYETTLFVQKVGLERFLFNLSRNQPLVYGLLSLFIAIAAGWSASAFFRYIRG